MPRDYLLLVTLALALALPGAAQRVGAQTLPLFDGPDYAGCGRPGNIFTSSGDCNVESCSDPRQLHHLDGEILQTKYADKLTADDVRAALHSNDDAKIRYLAAWWLADQGQKDVIPDIYQTFKAESEPHAKAYLACALAELGDRRGVEALHEFCKTDLLPEDLRLDVVRFLVEIGETPCLAPIVEALKGGDPYNWQAQSIIPHIKGLSSSESAQFRALLLGLLSKPGSAVRLVAAQTLAQMHDTSAIPALQAALTNESDAQVRKSLEAALKSLQAE